MSLLDSMKKSLFEEEAPQEKKVEKVDNTEARPTAQVVHLQDTTDVYQGLYEKTCFANTDVGKTIDKYRKSLEGMPGIDPNKTSFMQAKRLEGVKDEDILKAFETMGAALEVERSRFEKDTEEVKSDEVNAREDHLHQLEQEIKQKREELDQLQAQMGTVTQELAEWKGKIATVSSSFTSALQRRSAEIESERTMTADLLKRLV